VIWTKYKIAEKSYSQEKPHGKLMERKLRKPIKVSQKAESYTVLGAWYCNLKRLAHPIITAMVAPS